METFIDQFIDLLAEFNMDVYDEKELSDGKYRFDILIVEKDINELLARLRITNAVNKINQLWAIHDREIALESFRVNESGDTEFNFSVDIKFLEPKKEETPETKVTDEVEGKFVESDETYGFDYGPAEHIAELVDWKIYSDYSGKELNFDEAYIHEDGQISEIASKDEVAEIYRKDANQRKINGKLVDDFFEDEYTEDDFNDDFDWFAEQIDFHKLTDDKLEELAWDYYKKEQ